MRKLIMWNLITLDGYFEGSKPWDLDWHNSVWGNDLENLSIEQLHSADMLAFGRRTYEGMSSYWQNAEGVVANLMNSIPKLVFSRTLNKADWSHSTLITEEAVSSMKSFKRQGDRPIFVFGSAELSSTFLEAGLFDEYRILITPVILGNGTQLFGRNLKRTDLKLIYSKAFDSGAMLLKYIPK